ncbi:DISARM system helicase DrmA [Streptomyces sp. NPDC047860]|uniref:DISARM system helicase DrmA n=1 Tax=Streptomyces sp. NPDC047860 TaxID=3155743 RepID=UPI0033CFFE77
MSDEGVLQAPTAAVIRDELVDAVVADLLGPVGDVQEEIQERPTDRYLLGRLAPSGAVISPDEQDSLAEAEPSGGEEGDPEPDAPNVPSLFPSTFGFTACVDGAVRELTVSASWARYEQAPAPEGSYRSTVWRRVPMSGSVTVPLTEGDLPPDPTLLNSDAPHVRIRGRARRFDGNWLVSLFLVNDQPGSSHKQQAWLFQAELSAAASDGAPVFLRRVTDRASGGDAEDRNEQNRLAMTYRFHPEFAVGHGVAVHVEPDPVDPMAARRISTTAAPWYEVPQTGVPNAKDDVDLPELAELVTDMERLGAMGPAELQAALMPLVTGYRRWIEERGAEIGSARAHLDGFAHEANANLSQAREAADRIEAGIRLVVRDATARQAFAFANRAMHLQRVHSLAAEKRRTDPQGITLDAALDAYKDPRFHSWRPFQLAFVLLNLPSLADPTHAERGRESGIADLLWFPTGGGKTEAYLGLTAFTLAMRRLQPAWGGRDPHAGLAVLMRYTLRLLTIQQFQRAATLICACEVLRQADRTTWGDEPFRIGLWVGGKVTPNRTDHADDWLTRLKNDKGESHRSSPHQLTNCPWCGTPINAGRDIQVDMVRRRTLVMCPDPHFACPFTQWASSGEDRSEGLPVVVVDEEIYRLLPALVIATVDKFAQLPWKGETQALFGNVTQRCERHGYLTADLKDADWESGSHPAKGNARAARTVAVSPLRPPDLIIQDELHLISGPLGSLVGLYEAGVDRLCTWKTRSGQEVRPKVIASTATVRRAQRQIGALFLRHTRIFPPQGLDVSDSFFARQRPVPDTPGRRYLGICAHGVRIKSTLIRVYVAVLGAAQRLHEKYGHNPVTDPYMTLVGYFNSLRELGGMRRLVEDDVTTRLARAEAGVLARRYDLVLRELTSRLSSSDIPEILDQLAIDFSAPAVKKGKGGGRAGRGSKRPIDVLLATNMIAVGVDVSRLGVMVVANQPKSAAEYIQATSRVGRAAPGLVLTVLNWARPRDLSHYERFEHYHATIYRSVEALSVTPFAERAVDRGLTGVLTGLIRNLEADWNGNLRAQDVDRHGTLAKEVVAHLAQRAAETTGSAAIGAEIEKALDQRLDHWGNEQAVPARRLAYRRPWSKADDIAGLLHEPDQGPWRIATCPTSLRDVEPSVRLLLTADDLGDDGAPPFLPPLTPPGATGGNP